MNNIDREFFSACAIFDFKSMIDLIYEGADVNTTVCKTVIAETPLHLTARYHKDPAVAKFLIAHNACVDSLDDFCRTPLMIAVYNKNMAVVDVLLDAGADPYFTNSDGISPMSIAEAVGFNLKELICDK